MVDERKAEDSTIPPALLTAFDRLIAVQRPVVLANIRVLRKRRPEATPVEMVRLLEREYLAAVTTGGAAVGASAVIPGVGMGISLALSGVETAGFLETSALFAQSVAEVHGISTADPERARALVMALMLGEGGKTLVRQFAGQVGSRSSPVRPVFWGELVTNSLPQSIVGPLTDSLRRRFVRSFLSRHSGSVIGRMVPFGVGAVIGGTGNHLLGRRVVRAARDAFPPPPPQFPLVLGASPNGERPERAKRLRIGRRKPASQPAIEAPGGVDTPSG